MTFYSSNTSSSPSKASLLNGIGSTVKCAVIGILILLMLIPLALVEGIISERRSNNETVFSEIAQTWGGEQTLTGPILSVPYSVSEKDERGKVVQVQKTLHILPETLKVEGELTPEVRYRGIYEAVVYGAQMGVTGEFNPKIWESLRLKPEQLRWKDAYLTVGVSDIRGIQSQPRIRFGKTTLELLPGTHQQHVFPVGMYTLLNGAYDGKSKASFSMDLPLNGSRTFQVTPVGKESSIHLSSSWADPSFIGGYLPSHRNVGEKGFHGFWNVSYFSRSYPPFWTSDQGVNTIQTGMTNSLVGVSLMQPVDFYHQNERAVKYGILFLVLTFMAFFLFEVLSRTRVHIIQYGLVGVALCVFFLLLISLSEFVGFLTAYCAGALATIGLITSYIYGAAKVHAKKMATIVCGLLVGLYTYLYILLQLEDMALLVGAIGLFLILAIIMFITRKIDWYQTGDVTEGTPNPSEASSVEVRSLHPENP